MLISERHTLILQELTKKNSISIPKLEQLLDVSTNTIRRDLKQLHEEGKLERIQGGAIRKKGFDYEVGFINQSEFINPLQKQRIAQEASKYIQSGMTYIVDAGTTTQFLIPFLRTSSGITILTNSLSICSISNLNSTNTLIGCGGVVNPAINSFVGEPAFTFFESINADILFLGAKGITQNGLFNENYFETPVKNKMIQSADKVILLVDGSKFGRSGISRFGELSDIDIIITDKSADESLVSELQDLNIEVIVC